MTPLALAALLAAVAVVLWARIDRRAHGVDPARLPDLLDAVYPIALAATAVGVTVGHFCGHDGLPVTLTVGLVCAGVGAAGSRRWWGWEHTGR